MLLPLLHLKIASADEQVVVAQIYLVHLLSRLRGVCEDRDGGASSVRRFAERLYRSRYQSLVPEHRFDFVRFGDSREYIVSYLFEQS